jgi:hypothetical protein
VFDVRIRACAAVAASLLLSSVALAGPAEAAPASKSCVDLNNNGSCDPADPALDPLIEFGFFDTTTEQPGYEPTLKTGVILDNYTGTVDGLAIFATGNIHVRAT